MKALTVRQPWASLIAAGVKTIETRSWSTTHRGTIAIHAGAYRPPELTLAGHDWCVADKFLGRGELELQHYAHGEHGAPDPIPLPLGAVVAIAVLVGCVRMVHTTEPRNGRCLVVGPPPRHHMVLHGATTEPGRDVSDQYDLGEFKPGRYAWLLDNVTTFGPQPAKGRQGLWEWTP